jgi:hypothetical protein
VGAERGSGRALVAIPDAGLAFGVPSVARVEIVRAELTYFSSKLSESSVASGLLVPCSK